MSSRTPPSPHSSSDPRRATLPVVCLVTGEEKFHAELVSELLPWFQLEVRKNSNDLARWTREAQVDAVLIDIDSDGLEAQVGLTKVNELRRLDESFVVIRFSNPKVIDFQYLLSMIHDSFMSRPNIIVCPG